MRVLITGSTGRMGRLLCQEALTDPEIILAGALVRPQNSRAGQALSTLFGDTAQGLNFTTNLDVIVESTNCVIDFSLPEATMGFGLSAVKAGKAMVIGTTGFTAEQHQTIHSWAEKIPIVLASNTSLGITVLRYLVEKVAALLPSDYDIEISDAHHRYKQDSPSGTALALGNAASQGRGQALGAPQMHAGLRSPGSINFAVTRGGGIIGDHAVEYINDSERLTLSHQAMDRRLFAQGAMTAAKWLQHQPAGLYDMQDVLGLRERQG